MSVWRQCLNWQLNNIVPAYSTCTSVVRWIDQRSCYGSTFLFFKLFFLGIFLLFCVNRMQRTNTPNNGKCVLQQRHARKLIARQTRRLITLFDSTSYTATENARTDRITQTNKTLVTGTICHQMCGESLCVRWKRRIDLFGIGMSVESFIAVIEETVSIAQIKAMKFEWIHNERG